jgi:uncharacterized membrane protein YheB (UPF0754 family)
MSSRKPRGRQEEVEKKETTKKDLKKELRKKIFEKKLSRTSKVVRDERIRNLEEKLEDENLSYKEKNKLKEELDLLLELEDKEEENFINATIPEYFDD